MHLNDSLGHTPGLECICHHHEQACAIAAEGYARITGTVGVINVTTGPGGINALNGVFGAWTDSIPMLVLSGQVKRETCVELSGVPELRQLGDQEANIISMVKPITKYAVMITEPQSIRYHLERALFLAVSGRPGPCWLDIPLDVQATPIEEDTLVGYDPSEDALTWDMTTLKTTCCDILTRIQQVKRPVIMAGTGIRLAHATELFERVIRKLGIPVTTAWTHDLIASEDPLFCGRPGCIGTRAGNFTVQNADLLLVLGSRLNIRQTSYNYAGFARCAYTIQVDIDKSELEKPTFRPDLGVHADLRLFLAELEKAIDDSDYYVAQHSDWLKWCRERMERYPNVLPKHRIFNGKINPYHFTEVLFDLLREEDIVTCGNATATIMPYQAAKLKKGQRLLSNSGSASMGWDLPAAIGSAVSCPSRRIICLAGDGSIMMNLQELQTVAHYHLPIKLFILNNGGYLSIRSTQNNFFRRLFGESPQSGVSFPDMVQIGNAFSIPSRRIDQADFTSSIQEILAMPGPVLAEVILDPEQPFEPRVSSKQLPDGRIVSPPLEDMFPFLERDELMQNLLIPPVEYK